jgi:hypothetical protein
MGFNPFTRHTESQPEPVQVQTTVEPPADSKPAAEPDSQKLPDGQSGPAAPTPPSPAARASKVVNPFAGHANEKKPLIRLNRTHEAPPAQRLMAWLPRWPKATISVRDVRLYGPNSLRNAKIATDAIEVLAGYGWLVPVMTSRHDSKWWEIVRGRDPTVASSNVAGR